MQVTETSAEGLKREYAIVIPSGEIDEKMTEKLHEARKTFAMKGFRKGKAPLSLMRKMFGKSVLGETVQEMVDGAVRDIVEKNDLRPAMQPDVQIKNESFDEGDDLSVGVGVELLPDIEAVSYDSIELERMVVPVADEQVDEAIANLAENAVTYEARDEGAEAEDKDQVVLDFVGEIDGEAFDGGSMDDFPLVLGSGQFIPGFEEQLVGARAGDRKDIEVSFPEDYRAENLAGKAAVFKTEIKEVRAPQAMPVDDELAKRYGVESLEELRTGIAERIKAEYDQASRAHLKRRLLDRLDEMLDFDLPPSMVRAEADQIAHQLWHEEHPEVEGHDHEKIEPDESHLKIARRRVRLGLLLAKIGTDQDIRVTDEELNQAIFQQAQQYRGQEREFFDYVRTNQGMLNQIQAPIFEDKVVDHILENANVTEREVSKDELDKALEALEDADL